jgi:glycosyltransferase involved in cell wall biosynthesis
MRDGENGLLVERGEVEPLAQAVMRLLESTRLRNRIGAAARQTADELDVPRVAARYLEAFASL